MKRTTKYVGLDVHQATTVAAVREESGRVIARSILPTEGPAKELARTYLNLFEDATRVSDAGALSREHTITRAA